MVEITANEEPLADELDIGDFEGYGWPRFNPTVRYDYQAAMTMLEIQEELSSRPKSAPQADPRVIEDYGRRNYFIGYQKKTRYYKTAMALGLALGFAALVHLRPPGGAEGAKPVAKQTKTDLGPKCTISRETVGLKAKPNEGINDLISRANSSRIALIARPCFREVKDRMVQLSFKDDNPNNDIKYLLSDTQHYNPLIYAGQTYRIPVEAEPPLDYQTY